MKRLLFIFAAAVVLFCRCNDDMIDNSEDIIFPETDVSFEQHVQPLLNFNCSLSNCHSEYSAAGNVITSSYYYLFSSYNGALVIPGKPDNSVLIQILDGRLPHGYLTFWQINENQQQGMRTWIEEGARNN